MLLPLRFFLKLYESQSHSKSCAELGLSPPKGSRVLKQLRLHFKDDLFIRFGSKMVPTPKAVALFPKIQVILNSFDDLIETKPFDPATLKRNFRIAMLDNAVVCFLSRILPEFYKKAPYSSIEIIPVTQGVVYELRSGKCDLLIYPWRREFSCLHCSPLFEKNL